MVNLRAALVKAGVVSPLEAELSTAPVGALQARRDRLIGLNLKHHGSNASVLAELLAINRAIKSACKK